MGDHLGQLIELEISNVAHGGVMVARHEGRVVFVSDAIPGETVRAVVTDDSKARFWRADTVDVLAASVHRQEHVWSAASVDRRPEDRAGGAEFGHITPEHQRELKRRVLADALARMAGIDSDVVVEAVPGRTDGTGWRTRVRLHAAEDGTIGPFAARSHRVIRVHDLPLATDAVAAAAPLDGKFTGPVDLVAPSEGPVLVLSDDRDVPPITERVGDREFRLDARGFWQVHSSAAATLTAAVQEAILPGTFDANAPNLDLYGGVGLLAAAVGDRFGTDGAGIRITTVESDARATGLAGENLADWNRASAVTSRVDRYLTRLRVDGRRLDGATVVLDPPRSGAGKGVVNELSALAPAQVIYVACDPVALARDLDLFAAKGYRLERIRAFDLFPNTHHVEAVASIVHG
ncbi:MAG: class I SAM-dependent RNA methyltransferase [Micrococcales bacterium]|nr:class I SAM-dependent RNA methyltransferase [Micrococcales bacterium]